MSTQYESPEERKIAELLAASYDRLKEEFVCEDLGTCYSFTEKGNAKNFVTVSKKSEPFLALVNADFGFSRPAGSNNYPALLNVGRRFIEAFGVRVEW